MLTPSKWTCAGLPLYADYYVDMELLKNTFQLLSKRVVASYSETIFCHLQCKHCLSEKEEKTHIYFP